MRRCLHVPCAEESSEQWANLTRTRQASQAADMSKSQTTAVVHVSAHQARHSRLSAHTLPWYLHMCSLSAGGHSWRMSMTALRDPPWRLGLEPPRSVHLVPGSRNDDRRANVHVRREGRRGGPATRSRVAGCGFASQRAHHPAAAMCTILSSRSSQSKRKSGRRSAVCSCLRRGRTETPSLDDSR